MCVDGRTLVGKTHLCSNKQSINSSAYGQTPGPENDIGVFSDGDIYRDIVYNYEVK